MQIFYFDIIFTFNDCVMYINFKQNKFIIIIKRIALKAANLVKYTKMSTMTSRDVETRVQLLLQGELAKHAISVGSNAVAKYTASRNQQIFV